MGEVIAHIDYSENLKEKPKYETQFFRFATSKFTYIYHLSDVLAHDWKFTSTVVRDLVALFFINSSAVRIKNDNCKGQYKSLYVFGFCKKLAFEIQKPVIICYGAAGHGRGLVDAMSSFGIKAPLRKDIITDDFYWSTAEDLVVRFTEKSMGENMIYKELSRELIELCISIELVVLKQSTKQHSFPF